MILDMKTQHASPGWLPSRAAAGKLFATGATLGPIVDSLHNQCLLRYEVAPIAISSSGGSGDDSILFASSWLVPPLLGFAYVVLGQVLPRVFQKAIDVVSPVFEEKQERETQQQSTVQLGVKAAAAVATTAAIIKLSEYLVLHPGGQVGGVLENTAAFESATVMEQQLLILITAAVVQWAYLDGTLASLLVASVASIGGPLSELPFVAAGVWKYLPDVSDYLPLAGIETGSGVGHLLSNLLGKDYQSLGLSSITGPCYFAVTMDSIALGRFFDATSEGAAEEEYPAINGEKADNLPIDNKTVQDDVIPTLAVASEDSDDSQSSSSSSSST